MQVLVEWLILTYLRILNSLIIPRLKLLGLGMTLPIKVLLMLLGGLGIILLMIKLKLQGVTLLGWETLLSYLTLPPPQTVLLQRINLYSLPLVVQ